MIHEDWQRVLNEADAARPAASGLAHEAGLAYLPELAVVRFTGVDARSFLQGYLTCDTENLPAGKLTPTALCNLKGRVVMNGWCTPLHDDVILVLHHSLVDTLKTFLRPYLMFSKTTVDDQREAMLVFATLDLSAAAGGLALDERRRLFLVADIGQARALWDAHPHLGAEAWLASLTADGIPLVCAAVSAEFLPQMLNLETLGAIDFDKGCYLGQEVVARAQHRGQVKRRLIRLTWHGSTVPVPGAEVTDTAGRSVGVVVQSTTATADSGALLAVVQQNAPDALRQESVALTRAS